MLDDEDALPHQHNFPLGSTTTESAGEFEGRSLSIRVRSGSLRIPTAPLASVARTAFGCRPQIELSLRFAPC